MKALTEKQIQTLKDQLEACLQISEIRSLPTEKEKAEQIVNCLMGYLNHWAKEHVMRLLALALSFLFSSGFTYESHVMAIDNETKTYAIPHSGEQRIKTDGPWKCHASREENVGSHIRPGIRKRWLMCTYGGGYSVEIPLICVPGQHDIATAHLDSPAGKIVVSLSCQ